ncbi:MAG TPA: enoyl-CoA hydratase [Mariprofundaceae bacterium]|nr:enoyl-CoA hydratase [Mariprofundaceae bacterium]
MQLQTNLKQQRSIEEEFTSLEVVYEEEHALAWYYMNGGSRPCFTPDVLHNILKWYDAVKNGQKKDVGYIVAASRFEGSFNLGGDLALFSSLIRNQDRDGLLKYAIACIDVLYNTYTSLDGKVTTISLVQGDALGGGFEGAMSSDVLIAEKGVKMGFPEILFNLFPGMGAFSLLARKIGATEAETMILSGKLYSAEELYDKGIVHVLVNKGEGKRAVYDYIKKENRSKNGITAFRKAKHCYDPISYEELEKITTIWVDAALNLNHRDLRMMERLVKRQTVK